MKDLIKALEIFAEYADPEYSDYPTHCEHDVLMVCCNIQKDDISPAHVSELDELGFFWSTEFECWASFHFGSC
jgi:hypothetical protein